MLLGSAALDVAIGLVFVYLAASLVCSALNETVESMLKNRSKDLENGIRELLANESGSSKGIDMVQAIYDHPLISSLFRGDYTTARQNRELPSYIPARNFGLAL